MGLLRKIWDFYYTGFKSMTIGKKLWAIIIIKVIIIFCVLKLFFFKADFKGKSPQERSNIVIERLTGEENTH